MEEQLRQRIRELEEENAYLREREHEREREQERGAAMYDNSHVLEEMLALMKQNKGEPPKAQETPSVKTQKKKRRKGWSEENEKTVKKWQIDIEKSALLYSELLFKTMRYMNFVSVSNLILNACMVLFSALTVTLSFLEIQWVGVGFEMTILVLSGIGTILSGLLKIYAWEQKIFELSKFVEKLENEWYSYELEMNTSPSLRVYAADFIKRADKKYLSLMQQSPPIELKEYNKLTQRYKEGLLTSHFSKIQEV